MYFIYSQNKHYEVGAIITSILQMRKLRRREFEQLVQGYVASTKKLSLMLLPLLTTMLHFLAKHVTHIILFNIKYCSSFNCKYLNSQLKLI